MTTNPNRTYEAHINYLTPRLISYGRILEAVGFFLFIYLLWRKKLLYAIGAWVIVKLIFFLVSLFFAVDKSRLLTAKEEAQETFFLFSKSLASLILYYGIWTHSFETIFKAFNIFLFIYLIKWMQTTISKAFTHSYSCKKSF